MTDEMIQKALRLKEVDKLIIKAIATGDVEQLSKTLLNLITQKSTFAVMALSILS